MKFCPTCRRILNRHIETGEVIFLCVCGVKINGDAEDTLIDEEYSSNAKEESNIKFEDFIENSAFDPTIFTVKKDCIKCKRDYMAMIRIGEHKTVIYTCKCGHKTTD